MAPEKRRLGSWKEFLAYWEASRDIEEEALGAIRALRASNALDWNDTCDALGAWARCHVISLFLTEVLEEEYPELGELIYKEAVEEFLAIAEMVRKPPLGLPMYVWVDTTQRFLTFLSKNPPLSELQKRVRDFLRAVLIWDRPAETDRALLTQALLRYQMYDELERFVENRVYEAIPVLFEAVVEQMGRGHYWTSRAGRLVQRGWGPCAKGFELVHEGDWEAVEHLLTLGRAFRSVRKDSRVLGLLLDLATAYIDEYGRPYELPEATVDDGEWHHL